MREGGVRPPEAVSNWRARTSDIVIVAFVQWGKGVDANRLTPSPSAD